MSPGQDRPADPLPFLDAPADGEEPAVAVLPFGYEGTVSYGGGTREGPRAILEASAQVELYDEALGFEPCRAGIATLPAPRIPQDPAEAVEAARAEVAGILAKGMRPVVLGGEHAISAGVFRALAEAHDPLGVIQLDAHADLRDAYGGTPHSHACVMARIREATPHVLQLGIRSLSREEAERIGRDRLAVGFMDRLRDGRFDLDGALAELPETVFLTLDVDALDLSVVRATGTPEPGGFTWTEINDLLARIFARKRVAGFDVVELCGGDAPSAFAAARLVQRMIGRMTGNGEA